MGVIAYMLLCGYPPFNGSDDGEILHRVKIGQYHFAHSPFKRVSQEAKDFIRKLLIMEPEARMTMAEAQNHPWMEKDFGGGSQRPEQTEEEIEFSKQVIQNLAKFSSKKTLQKIALEVVAYSIGSTENTPTRRGTEKKFEIIDMLRREFERIDTDGTGEIDFVELKEAMANTHVKDEELQGIFDNMDVDNSGTINFTEFLAAAIPEDEIEEEHIQWAFERLSGQTGDMISKDELTEILGIDKTEEEIEAMLDEAIEYAQRQNRHKNRMTSTPGRIKTQLSAFKEDEDLSTPPRILKVRTRDLNNTPITKNIDYDTFLALIKSVPDSLNSPYFKAVRSERLKPLWSEEYNDDEEEEEEKKEP
jgi:calcium-dependent protein kinase